MHINKIICKPLWFIRRFWCYFVRNHLIPANSSYYFLFKLLDKRVYLVCPPLTLTRLLLALTFFSTLKPVCSSLSPFLPFFLPYFPLVPKFLNFIPSPSIPPPLLTFFFVSYSPHISLPPLCFYLPFLSSLISPPPSTYTYHSLLLPSILSTIPSLSSSSSYLLVTVAAGVGMWACLTEFCMRGLSNFYSDSKKRIRTSYQSKSGLPKGWGTLCVCLCVCAGGMWVCGVEQESW